MCCTMTFAPLNANIQQLKVLSMGHPSRMTLVRQNQMKSLNNSPALSGNTLSGTFSTKAYEVRNSELGTRNCTPLQRKDLAVLNLGPLLAYRVTIHFQHGLCCVPPRRSARDYELAHAMNQWNLQVTGIAEVAGRNQRHSGCNVNLPMYRLHIC